ncbi:MAG: EAL domain-containing protein [Burkholderiaceae bacterium]
MPNLLHKRLFERQIEQARDADGGIDLERLQMLVLDSYREFDRALSRSNHANQLVGDELIRANARLGELVRELEHSNRCSELALNTMSQGLCLLDEHARIVLCNERFCKVLGLPESDRLPGQALEDVIARHSVFSTMTSDSMQTANTFLRMVRSEVSVNAQLEMPDGRILRIAHEVASDRSSVQTIEDVTERHTAEKTIAHLATHDALTNLPNRRLLSQRLANTIQRAQKHHEHSVVMCLDLDRFKTVNDTLGHSVGDRLLQLVAARLRDSVRGQDTVARLGGDEFAIILEGPLERKTADTIARRIVDRLGRPFDIDGVEALVGVSIGIAKAPEDGLSADSLLKCADIAMYHAKQQGRGRFEHFTRGMDALAIERRQLELDLRRAIQEEQFYLDYQPVFDIASGRICGAEALLRWNSPERGRVAPDAFIPLAEEIGLIVTIGEWVLREACAQAATWPAHVRIAVNVSARQFADPHLFETVTSALSDAGLAPERLELELTESVLMSETGSPMEVLHRLRKLGVRIAMDDFGTGYSSLAYLRTFPFDKIKIDRSFIDGLGSRVDATAIVRAVATLCANLGVASTAEGVETAEQLALLGVERCTQAQGFHLARPGSPAKLSRFFEALSREDDGSAERDPAALAERAAPVTA